MLSGWAHGERVLPLKVESGSLSTEFAHSLATDFRGYQIEHVL